MNINLIKPITIAASAIVSVFFSVQAQSIVNNDASIFISNNAAIYVNGGIQNNAFLQNSGSIFLSDTFTNDGVLEGSGKVLFYGNGNYAKKQSLIPQCMQNEALFFLSILT